jgi:phosphatidylinositol alpha-1,6-mannosyltransferase
LEAGLSRKACIGGNSGGIADAVIDDITGKLIDPNDPDDVANTAIYLLKNRNITKQLRENGFKRASRLFDWRNNVTKLEKELNYLYYQNENI